MIRTNESHIDININDIWHSYYAHESGRIVGTDISELMMRD